MSVSLSPSSISTKHIPNIVEKKAFQGTTTKKKTDIERHKKYPYVVPLFLIAPTTILRIN